MRPVQEAEPLSVSDNLQQIAVGVEEIQTVVIAPVYRSIGRDTVGTESILGGTEIGQADLKGVVSLAQGVLGMISDSRRKMGPFEQSQHVRTAARE